jgi:Polysaccharide lyase
MSLAAIVLALVAVVAAVAVGLLLVGREEVGEGGAARLDFETGDLSQYDIVERAAPDRVRVVTDPRRQGGYAARFEVRAGDTPTSTTGTRAELIAEHDDGRKPTAGEHRWYRWSTLFASRYPLVDRWQTFVQWKNDGPGSPPLAMTVQGGEIRLSGGEQNGFHIFWRGPIQRGRWHDFVAHVLWSADPERGLVELWHNGRRAVPPTHVATMYRTPTGDPIANYLKIGLYRHPAIKRPQVLYHDDVVVAARRETVVRDGSG